VSKEDQFDFAAKVRRQIEKAKNAPKVETPNSTTGATSPSDQEPWSLSTDQVIATMALVGDPVPTGCPFIDRELRHEGIPAGKLILVCGPPQSGKSLLLAQSMLHMAKTNPVYTLMADAGWHDVSVSIASMVGLDRTKVERKPSEMAQEAKTLLAEVTLTHVNPEHPEATLKRFFDYVTETCPKTETPVVFVDSAQVIRHGLGDPPEDKTVPEIIGAMCRTFAIRRRAIVFLSSKANRASWKYRRKDENTVPLAGSMGGDFEYTADLVLFLSLPDKKTGFIRLEWAKNRLGKPHPQDVTLRYDQFTCSLLEVDEAEIDSASATENNNRLGPIKLKIRAALKGQPPLSKNAICELVKGKRTDKFEAISALVDEKKLDVYPAPSGRGMLYKLISREPEEGTSN
jgi:archaellum biogenesis ATPase FlaH